MYDDGYFYEEYCWKDRTVGGGRWRPRESMAPGRAITQAIGRVQSVLAEEAWLQQCAIISFPRESVVVGVHTESHEVCC